MLSSFAASHLRRLADHHQLTPSQYAATMTDEDYCWLQWWTDPDCVCARCLTIADTPKLLDPDTDALYAAWEMKRFILSGHPLGPLDRIAAALAQQPQLISRRLALREMAANARQQLRGYITGH